MSIRMPGPLCLFLNALPIDEHTLAPICSSHPGIATRPKVSKKAAKRSPAPSAGITQDGLLAHYALLFVTCEINPTRLKEVIGIVAKIQVNIARYKAVETASGAPWHVVAVIHNMESGLRFDRHLHNGDPLTHRTVQVPAGRPKTGNPPFTWETSAVDALSMKGFSDDWSLPATLKKLEDYNGIGYRKYHPDVNTPYLWSGSNQYTSGKYVADGKFSKTAVSGQIGAALILKQMMDQGLIPSFVAPWPDSSYTTFYA